jgi:integrase
MALTDTFTKNIKHSGAAAGDKHTDGGGMYLLVNKGGKYWRMNYRFADKRKTLALGVYPAVFVRPGELRTAEWAELDLDAAEWRIPGRKMKMKVDHLVPLSAQAGLEKR